ncbi:MAG: glycine-rich domain-containing protein, partial [Patescibacteria group bacterium]
MRVNKLVYRFFLIFAIVVGLVFPPYFFNFSKLAQFQFPFEKQEALAADTVIFLTTGTSWTVPADWNSASNTIEVIGGGGGGGGKGTNNPNEEGGGGGGGGGVYAKAINQNLPEGGTVGIQIGAGGAGGAAETNGATGTDTFFCNSTTNCASATGTA